MTFTAAGMKRLTHIGAIGVGASSVRSLWSYVTNDDAATLETANYFDAFLSEFRIGDQIIASIDLDGTPTIRVYVVTSVTSHVSISRETTVVVGDQAAAADLQENSGAIGGTNDGNLPDLTATYTARTSPIGTADGAMQTVGATNGSDVSAAIMNNFAEVLAVVAQLAADNVAIRAAIREVAAAENITRARLRSAGLISP